MAQAHLPAFIARWLRSPSPPSRGPQAQAAQCKDGRPLKRRASVRARASTCSFDLRIGRNGRRLCRCASRRMSACARRIRAQHPTRMSVNARKSSYGMKQSTDQSINLQERKNNSWHPSAETNEFEPMPLAESDTISISWFRQMRLRRYCHHRCDDQYLEV